MKMIAEFSNANKGKESEQHIKKRREQKTVVWRLSCSDKVPCPELFQSLSMRENYATHLEHVHRFRKVRIFGKGKCKRIANCANFWQGKV